MLDLIDFRSGQLHEYFTWDGFPQSFILITVQCHSQQWFNAVKKVNKIIYGYFPYNSEFHNVSRFQISNIGFNFVWLVLPSVSKEAFSCLNILWIWLQYILARHAFIFEFALLIVSNRMKIKMVLVYWADCFLLPGTRFSFNVKCHFM